MPSAVPPEHERWWHPVCAENDLGAAPLAVRLFGQDLVLWRHGVAADGGTVPIGVSAFEDRCPHRGARLSLGRVVGAQLQCAYHGWCFDAAGACRQVPALPGFVPPPGHRVAAWQVARAHGLLWLARAPHGAAPPALQAMPARRLLLGPYDVATSAGRVVENFLDASHFAFVHEGWLGDAARPEVPPYEVTHTADGRPVVVHSRTWQPQATASAQGGAWVDYRHELLAPFAATLRKHPADGQPGDAYTLWCCPVDEELTRVWFVQGSDDVQSTDETLRAFQDQVFAQDKPVLLSQRPARLPLSGGESGGELHSAADRLSIAYRRWLQARGVTYGCC